MFVYQGFCRLSLCDPQLQKEPDFAVVLWEISMLCTPPLQLVRKAYQFSIQ